jgi:ABC-type dipeptide/oligopeptide/nickel transport system permease subunit
MKTPLLSWRRALGGLGFLILAACAALLVIGLQESPQWTTQVYVGGYVHGTQHLLLAPFPILTSLDVFDLSAQSQGTHLYLLGSDPGGRDLLGLVARGSLPSLALVAVVVAGRLALGLLAGLLMALGVKPVRTLSRGIGDWLVGFPYLALAIVLIDALAVHGRTFAFVVALCMVGWRDIAELVAERIEHVQSQPYALASTALGTRAPRFFQLHVLPHLRPALGVELVLQCSAVLVLLAELGYLQVYLGPALRLTQVGGNSLPLISSPELGQLLANSRMYLLYREAAPFLVPALSIAVLALGFELMGTALRGRWRFAAR